MKLAKKAVLNICASCLYRQKTAIKAVFEEFGDKCLSTRDAAVQYVYTILYYTILL